MTPFSKRLVVFLATYLAPLAQEDRGIVLAFCESLADPLVTSLVTAFANALPSGGVKNLDWGPVKAAVLAAIPGDVTATNAAIEEVIDEVISALSS